jgi:hypothetical protein
VRSAEGSLEHPIECVETHMPLVMREQQSLSWSTVQVQLASTIITKFGPVAPRQRNNNEGGKVSLLIIGQVIVVTSTSRDNPSRPASIITVSSRQSPGNGRSFYVREMQLASVSCWREKQSGRMSHRLGGEVLRTVQP